MPWCPKCWEEYPKDFTACNVCEVPLTEEKPEGAKKESGSQAPASEKRLPRFLRSKDKKK